MAHRRQILRRLLRSTSLTTLMVSCSFSTSATADTKTADIIPSAMSIARQIEEQSLIEVSRDKNLVVPKTASEAINQVHETLTQGNEVRLQKALLLFRTFAEEKKEQTFLDIYNMYLGYSKLNDVKITGNNYEAKRDYLIKIGDSKNWFVSFHAKRLLAVVHSESRKSDFALKAAQDALKLIPNELNDETINARIVAVELIAYLQNLKLNKNLALINTQRLIDLKIEAGQSVDGIELINNLMYSLTAWRDNEARLKLAQTLKRLEEIHGSTTPGLSNMHISRVYVDIGDYEKAIPAAEDAIAEANIDSLQQISKINLATAYAGLGNTTEARRILNTLPKTAQGAFSIPYAETVIALKEGRVDEALALMNERYDSRVQIFLRERTNNTMEMLASLGNSSERQAEREAALKREQAFVQAQLEQQQDINKLLLALIALVGLSGLAALLFAHHRHKLANQLAIKTEEAESADRMKTEFLGMVSHELRTPLNGIIGVADVLVDQAPTEQVRERGNIILSSGNLLFSMIESIIDMSRIDGDKLELVTEATSLSEIVNTLSNNYRAEAAKKGVVFTTHISQNCPDALAIDPKYTEKIIDTLLSNAVKFTEKGRVHMHITSDIDETSKTADIKIIVADTGQGISEEVQSKLFKPFLQADSSMTRKYGGSGLHLAIARSIVRMMNGDITVNSREGRGSEFTLSFEAPVVDIQKDGLIETVHKDNSYSPPLVSLPDSEDNDTYHNIDANEDLDSDAVFEMIELVIDETAYEDIPQSTQDTPSEFKRNASIEGLRVLIVEDTPSNQDVVELLLTEEGLQCLCVDNGPEALSTLTQHSFDIIIMDIRMPEMDGVETTRRIRQSGEPWANIPIIALTADIAAENNAACMAAGTDIFLTKPVLARELTNAIEFLQQQRKESDGQPVLLLQDIA